MVGMVMMMMMMMMVPMQGAEGVLQVPSGLRELPVTQEIGEFETFNELADETVCGEDTCALHLDPSLPAEGAERCCSSLVAPGTEAGACVPASHVCCGCSDSVCCACPRTDPHAPPVCLPSCSVSRSGSPGVASCYACCQGDVGTGWGGGVVVVGWAVSGIGLGIVVWLVWGRKGKICDARKGARGGGMRMKP